MVNCSCGRRAVVDGVLDVCMISGFLRYGTVCCAVLCCGRIFILAGLQWLMGPSAVSDVELDDGSRVKSHGIKVERCRVLEQLGDRQISEYRV